jgi:hypothetical protein
VVEADRRPAAGINQKFLLASLRRACEAKAVTLAGRRYIVCRNHQPAQKDAADRASIVAALQRQLAKGNKALIGNTGYRRYLKTIRKDHFTIDRAKVEDDAKFDGIFVLRTNTELKPLDEMLCYKQLWTVEQIFRTAKNLPTTRPIFHKLDETIRGHVFCSFLALVLKKALETRSPHLIALRPGRTSSPTSMRSPKLRSSRTANTSPFAQPRARQPALPSAPLAWRCRPSCAQLSTTDLLDQTPKNVVPRRRHGSKCHCGSITSQNQL